MPTDFTISTKITSTSQISSQMSQNYVKLNINCTEVGDIIGFGWNMNSLYENTMKFQKDIVQLLFKLKYILTQIMLETQTTTKIPRYSK